MDIKFHDRHEADSTRYAQLNTNQFAKINTVLIKQQQQQQKNDPNFLCYVTIQSNKYYRKINR